MGGMALQASDTRHKMIVARSICLISTTLETFYCKPRLPLCSCLSLFPALRDHHVFAGVDGTPVLNYCLYNSRASANLSTAALSYRRRFPFSTFTTTNASGYFFTNS